MTVFKYCTSLSISRFGWVSNTDCVLHFYFPAIKDYETAAKHSENDRQIKEGLERAQRLLKQSQKRDYYKILGVKRWALITGVLAPCFYSYRSFTGEVEKNWCVFFFFFNKWVALQDRIWKQFVFRLYWTSTALQRSPTAMETTSFILFEHFCAQKHCWQFKIDYIFKAIKSNGLLHKGECGNLDNWMSIIRSSLCWKDGKEKLFLSVIHVLMMLSPLSQNCPEKGDYQSLQETGTTVASGQLPGSRGKEEGWEEVHWHRSG